MISWNWRFFGNLSHDTVDTGSLYNQSHMIQYRLWRSHTLMVEIGWIRVEFFIVIMLRVVPPLMGLLKGRSFLPINFCWPAKCPWPTIGEQEVEEECKWKKISQTSLTSLFRSSCVAICVLHQLFIQPGPW